AFATLLQRGRGVPRRHRLESGSHRLDFLDIGLAALQESVCDISKRKVYGICVGQKGHEPPLMLPVVENGDFRCTVRPELAPLVGIPDGDRQSGFGGAETRSRHSYATGDQRAQHCKKPAIITGYRAVKLSVLRNVRKAVEHVVVWNRHVVEGDDTIVDTVESHFSSAVADGNARQHGSGTVADGHQKGIHTV